MTLRTVVIRIALIVAVPLAVSCVPKSQLDEVSEELASARTAINSLEAELERVETNLSTAETQVEELDDALEEKRLEYEQLERELEDVNTQAAELQSRIDKARAQVEVLSKIIVPSITGDIYTMSESESLTLFLEWADSIEATGDEELQSRFMAMIDTAYSEQVYIDFFVYLIESTSASLE